MQLNSFIKKKFNYLSNILNVWWSDLNVLIKCMHVIERNKKNV